MAEPAKQTPRMPRSAALLPRIRQSLVRRPLSWVSGLAALLMAVLLVESLAAGTLAPMRLGGPQVVTPGVPAQLVVRPGEIPPWTIQLSTVAAVSSSDVWAVGAAETARPLSGLLLHFDGSTWRRVHNPAAFPLTALSVLPTGEVWAVGWNAVFRERDGVWTQQYTYTPPANMQAWLSGISMVSSDEGWAVGAENGASSQRAFLLHYHDGVWTRQDMLEVGNASSLFGISMYSAVEGWAVGTSYADIPTAYVLHYQNGHWAREGPGFALVSLASVSAAGPDDAWAVGAGGSTSGIAVHCVNSTCAPVSVPTPNLLGAVSMRSPSHGWIAGDGAATLRYDGQQWTKEGVTIHGEHLTGIAMTSDGDGWAVGAQYGDATLGSPMLRCQNGVWQAYPLHILDHDG